MSEKPHHDSHTDVLETKTEPRFRYTLEFIAFMAGALVMIFEIVGSRIIAPYLGTSTYVWTSIIGVILASLSIGYWLGGRIADKKPSVSTLARILLLAGFGVAYALIIKDTVLPFLQAGISHLAFASLVASVILFTPGSILLGMVTPVAVRLKMNDVAHSGRTVGNLYAISTLGSIVGTFGAGFYLIPALGSELIILILACMLWILTFVVEPRILKSFASFVFFGGAILLTLNQGATTLAAEDGVFETDTPYSYVKIYDTDHPQNGLPLTVLQLNTEMHSGRYANGDPSLAFDYTRYYHLARHFQPDISRALMLGGGAMSYPRDFVSTYPDATIDVVEIDPELPDLARLYFGYTDPERINIHITDGRVYANQTSEQYDVILGDAFTSYYSVPYHLSTIEATKTLAQRLTDDGVMLTNIIGTLEGPSSSFLKAEYATYEAVFPYVYLVPVSSPSRAQLQNIMLIGSKKPMPPVNDATDAEIREMLSHTLATYSADGLPILTDDHAPVDYYMSSLLHR